MERSRRKGRIRMEPVRQGPVSLRDEGDLDGDDAPGDPVQESEEESFPASDPPSQWAG
jgi:hypothetical protein